MRKLLWFTLGFSAACLAAVYLLPEARLPWAAGIGAALLLGLFAFRRLRRKRPASGRGGPISRRLLCAALGLGLGLLWCWGYGTLILSPARNAAGRYERLTATVLDYPEQTDYGHRAEVLADLPAGAVRARLYLYGDLPPLEPGDRIAGAFTLRRADLDRDGDTRLDLQAKGILLTGSGRVEATRPGGRPLRFFPVRFSRAVFDRLAALLPPDAAGLPQAMLTGNRSGLSPADRAALAAAGASHVIAVSGLHVTMLLGVVVLLTGSRGRAAAALGIPLLALYALMTGASPSVVRASVMLGLLLLAPLLGEENDSPTSLAGAGLVLLAANPWTVANLSFQLSFGAVAGLLLLTGPMQNYFLNLPRVKAILGWTGPKAWSKGPRECAVRLVRALVRGFWTSIAATLGALVFTTPIAACCFGYVPVYSVVTNLLVLPLATVCLVGALGVLALGLVSTAPGTWAGWVLAWPVRALTGICRGVARLPGARLELNRPYGLLFLFFLYLVLLLALLLREKRFGRPLLCVLAALAAAVGLQTLDRPGFLLAALDVGQGQCLCMSCGGRTVLVDCGGSAGSYTGTLAAEGLRRRGLDRVDALVLTHYDADHVNGVPELLAQVEVGTVCLPNVDFDPEARQAVEDAALAAGCGLVYVEEDLRFSFPGGEMTVTAPLLPENDNAASLCVLYSVGEYDMLITGDLDAAGEYALLDHLPLPRVELYVAGHHGSKTSSTEALLQAIRPELVWISVGSGNHYKLPSPEALARLEAAGARVYRTDLCGDLEIGR